MYHFEDIHLTFSQLYPQFFYEIFYETFYDIGYRQRELHLHQFRLLDQFGLQPVLLVPSTENERKF